MKYAHVRVRSRNGTSLCQLYTGETFQARASRIAVFWGTEYERTGDEIVATRTPQTLRMREGFAAFMCPGYGHVFVKEARKAYRRTAEPMP